jgi:hypothetical protein
VTGTYSEGEIAKIILTDEDENNVMPFSEDESK